MSLSQEDYQSESLKIEAGCNSFHPRQYRTKRLMDLTLVICGGLLISPLLLVIACLIKLDSKGNVFYRQTRLGQGGHKFRVWKFRTMVHNADQALNECLSCHPALSAEWEATHKLKNDPRVTRLGRFLRKYSLDEFPQLWNVLRGEMSLVGPRPIVEDEVKFYGERIRLLTSVLPGITGLWQISGRSDTSYDERVRLDEQYIFNWSIWLDILTLLRTIRVLLQRGGAY